MSNESEGSGSQSIDVPSATKSNAVQETEHDIATSQLAVSQSAESLFPALYHSLSPQSASLMSSKLPATFPVSSVHARYDEREHQNLDATQYSRQSSEGSSQDTLEDQDARTTPQFQPPSSEEGELSMPHQVEETDSATSKMVITDYNSESLSSLYFMIQRRAEATTNSNVNSQPLPLGDNTTSESVEATQLFAMDDDEEPTQQDMNKAESDDSSSAFTSRLSLNFANEQSAIPNLPSAAGSTASSASDQSKVKDKESTVPRPAAVPDSTGHIDRADVHRDTTNNLQVANTGETTTGIKREKLCMSISNCSQDVNYNIPKFYVGDTKVESVLHSQGQDKDYKEHKVTVTSILHLPKYAKNADSLYARQGCTFKLSIHIYEGPVENNKILGQASAVRKLSEEERQNLMVHMTVHSVASQEDIIFSRRCPEKLFVKVKGEMLH